MLWFHSQNKITSKAELALSSSSLTFSASGTTIDLNVITNIPANEVTYEVNSSGVFTVNKNGYTLTISTGNLGTTITPQQSSTITVKARNLTATCTLIRQANVITQTKVIRDNGAEAVSSFLASGGVGVYVCQNTFTSGSKNNGDRGNVDLWSCSLPGAIKKLYTIEGDGVVWKAVSFTIPSKGNVVSDITNFTITTTDGIGATLNCTQAANKVESLDIRSWEDKTPITSISAIGVADTWYHAYATYTSNTKSRVQGEYSGWSTNASWISLSKTNNTDNAVSVTIGSRGTTPGAARSGTLSFTYGGKASSITLTQAKNYITSLKIGGGSTTSFIPATLTYSAAGGSNPFTGWAVYTTGDQTCITTWAAGDWVLSQSYFSKTLSNGVVTVIGEYRGTTVGSQRTGTLTVNLNSSATENKQLSAQVTLTQAENTKAYGAITISDFHYPEASATANATSSPVIATSQAVSYDSGAKTTESITGTRSFAISGLSPTYVTLDYSTGVLTWKQNTSGSSRSVIISFTVTANGQSANNSYNASQSAGVKTYSNVTVSLSYSKIPAGGGTVSPTISYSQTWGWNGSTTGGGTITTGGTVTYSGASSSNGAVTAASKGKNISGVTTVATVTAKVSLNGKEGTATYSVQQAENKCESVRILNAGNFDSPTTSYLASGQTSYYTAYFTLSAGDNREFSEIPLSAWSLSSTDGFVLKGSYYVNVTATNRGSTIGDARSTTLKITYQGVSAQLTLTQEANKYTSVEIRHINDYSSPRLSYEAKGGSDAYTALFTTTAGTSGIETTLVPYSAWSISSTDGFTMSSGSTGGYYVNISAANRGTVLGNARTTVLKVTYSGVSSQITLTQAENTREATSVSGGTLTYSNITAGTITNVTIPAKGGSATATAGKGKQPWQRSQEWTTYTYSSGATKDEVTGLATSGTNDVNPSVASITASATSKGVIVSNQTVVKSQAVTWSANGKSASGTMYIYQQENKVVSTEYAIPVISTFTYPDIPAKGGTVLPTISWSQTIEDTYTSEQSKDRTITTGGTVTYSGSAVNPQTGSYTQGTKGTTESARNRCITATVTVVANGRTGTKTTDIYQAANTKTTTYSDVTITTFGYAEAPASGSVLSPTLSYKQTKTDSYTSGSSVPTDITSGASVSYKGGTNTGVDGKVRIPSRGTVEGPRTGIEEVTVTVTLNSKSASSTVTVYQAANEVTSKKISPQDPVPTQETIPATQAGYSYSGGECDLVYKYSSGSSKVAMSIGEPGASQYGLGVTLSLVDSSGNISASGNYVTFGANTTTSERYAIVNMKFVTNQSDWDSDIYQITITQEAKSGPGTLTIKFLGTAPRIAYYVQMLINGIAVTGPTRYSVQSSINGFTISKGELSYVLAINPGSGNILVNLADSNGGSPSYRAELTQPQVNSLLNGTSISIFANKLA